MTGLSTSPRLIKGALVGVDPMNPLASVVAFQKTAREASKTLAEKPK